MQRSDEKLYLQWNDFQQNLTSAFRNLRDDKDFIDVTLACEDGQQVEAHKVVLISSSPFFRSLLQRNKHTHPLIYMRGVKSEDLVAMMDFLYHGEVKVFQENLESFLAIAEDLQLRGLRGNQAEAMPGNKSSSETRSLKINQEEIFKLEDGIYKPYPSYCKNKSINIIKSEPNQETAVALNSNTTYTNTAELGEKVKSMMLVGENPVPGITRGNTRICKVCGKEGQNTRIVHHIEANHIDGIILPCNICGKISSTRAGLARHRVKSHSQ